jgi:hypothetical protein
MNEADIDQEYRSIINSFIDLANKHCETASRENVSMALLYAASRFNSFVVASHASDIKKYESDRGKAFEFFTREYQKMLNENLDDYKKFFDENMKYAHLINTRPS